MAKLGAFEIYQMKLLAAGVDIASLRLDEDRARSRLKRLGYITFNRKAWRWELLDAGRAALKEQVG